MVQEGWRWPGCRLKDWGRERSLSQGWTPVTLIHYSCFSLKRALPHVGTTTIHKAWRRWALQDHSGYDHAVTFPPSGSPGTRSGGPKVFIRPHTHNRLQPELFLNIFIKVQLTYKVVFNLWWKAKWFTHLHAHTSIHSHILFPFWFIIKLQT